MREYAKIYTAIWRSKKFRGLPNDAARHLYLYLHTCQHSNMIGCYVLPNEYAQADLGWDIKGYAEAMLSLKRASLVGYDEAENLVRIIDFIAHDPFTNERHAMGAVSMAKKLPDCVEKQRLMDDLRQSKHVKSGSVPEPQVSLSIASSPEPEPEPEPEPHKREGKPSLALSAPKIKKTKPPDRFAEFWDQYPHRNGAKKGRAVAEKAWIKALMSGATESEIIEAAMRLASDRQVIEGFAKDPATWLNQKGWNDDIEPIPYSGTNGTPKPTNGGRYDNRAFDSTINQLADDLTAGTIKLDTRSRDPFAPRSGGGPEADQRNPRDAGLLPGAE